MSAIIGEGTARGNILYLTSLVDKGRSRNGVIAPLKTALRQVLQVTEGAGWEQTDMRHFDAQDAMVRFKNLTMGKYSPDSYRAYETRVSRAIKWYRKFLDNPGWSPQDSLRENAVQNKQAVDKAGFTRTAVAVRTHAPYPAVVARSDSHSHELAESVDVMNYPFPLSKGGVVSLSVPRAITHADVKRLTAFLEALVVEEHADG